MKFTVAAAAALVAGASAQYNQTGPVYTTQVVTAYTTYCPAATQITHNGQTYTVTQATTLTITNCPCTITKPVPTAPAPYSSAPAVSVPAVSSPGQSAPAPVYTPPTVSSVVPKPYPNGTVSTPVYSAPAGTGSTTKPSASAPAFTGAANKAFAASGAGLAAVFGLAAYVL